MNKTLLAAVIGIATLSTGCATAGHRGGDFVDTAKVISATPIYESVRVSRPVEECWKERVVHHRSGRDSYTPALAGGIIGGVIGNQFGRGDGRTAMTVAGTLLGASIGRDLGHRPDGRGYVTHERRCEVVDRYEHEEQLVGYRVTYRYKGETFVTRTDEHPGDRIPVRVDVQPLHSY